MGAERVYSAVASSGERDVVRERHVSMVRTLLGALIVSLLLAFALDLLLYGPEALGRRGPVLLLGATALAWLARLRLRAGHLGQAVGWVLAAALIVLAVETADAGMSGSPAFLFAYSVPIAFAGLLIGRLALLLTAGASVAIVAGVYLLELAEAPWVGNDVVRAGPETVVIVFALVIGLLAFVVERFGVELKEAHAGALARQRELARLVAQLSREIDERKQAELARKQSEERLAFVTETVGIATWSWDIDSGEFFWSEQLRRLLEIPSDEPPSHEAFLARAHPDDRELLQRVGTNPDEAQSKRELTYRVVRGDGSIGWMTVRYRTLPASLAGGRVMVGVIYEVTDNKREEQERDELLERERWARETAEAAGARLSFLAEASHLLASSLDFGETLRRLTQLMVPRWADWCAVDVVDEEGIPRRLSVAHADPEKVEWAHELRRRYTPRPGGPSAETALAEGRTQYLPRISDADLVRAAQGEEHLEILRGLGFASLVVVPLSVREKRLGALTLVYTDGRHYGEDDVLFFEELAGRAAVAVENSRLFDEIRALNQELERRVDLRTSELRDALGELESFAYSVSHDLRAPLRGIDGFSMALLEDYGDRLDDDARQYLDRIRSGAGRMGELIDDLLNLSRLSQGELNIDRVDLGALAEEVVKGLREKEPERHVDVRIAPELVGRGDARLLRIALENIIANAWKFTASREEARIEVGVEIRAEERVYFVRDNGIGFDMRYADKLFTPFQRLHSPQEFEGTGIGLATAQRVMRRHGGRIWAQSVEGEGATFYFTLAD